MNLINQITNNSRQRQTIPLEDGSFFEISLYFIPMQFGWFIEELIYGKLTIKSIRVCNSPNILAQFKNKIPFGIACFSSENREPSQQNDFISGASNLYVLSAAEVLEYEEFLSE